LPTVDDSAGIAWIGDVRAEPGEDLGDAKHIGVE